MKKGRILSKSSCNSLLKRLEVGYCKEVRRRKIRYGRTVKWGLARLQKRNRFNFNDRNKGKGLPLCK